MHMRYINSLFSYCILIKAIPISITVTGIAIAIAVCILLAGIWLINAVILTAIFF